MIVLTHEILELVTDNNAFIVLVKSIAKRASFDKNQKCFPGTATMCKDTGLSRSTVIRARQWLADNKIISIKKKGLTKDGQYEVNEYLIETDLIKVIGSLKSKGTDLGDGEDSATENLPSVTKNLPSVTKKPGVVSKIDSNLKSNLTSSPYNHKKEIKKEKFDYYLYVHELVEQNKIETDIADLIFDWLQTRKSKNITQRVIDLNLKVLYGKTKQIQIQILENAIKSSWTGLFEPKQFQNYQKPQSDYQERRATLLKKAMDDKFKDAPDADEVFGIYREPTPEFPF